MNELHPITEVGAGVVANAEGFADKFAPGAFGHDRVFDVRRRTPRQASGHWLLLSDGRPGYQLVGPMKPRSCGGAHDPTRARARVTGRPLLLRRW